MPRTRGTDVEGGKSEGRESAEWNDTAGPAGVGARREGAVVMGCDEPLARGGGARHTIGAVWFGANRACGRAFRDAGVCCGWAGGLRRCHGVVTSGAKHGGTQGNTLRRLVQVGGKGGTSWDG